MKIRIAPTTIFFDDVSDEVLAIIDGLNLEVHTAPKGFRVSSTPQKLYGLIVALAQDFDIEIV